MVRERFLQVDCQSLILIITPAGSYYILVRETAGPNVGCSIASANFNILESPEFYCCRNNYKIPLYRQRYYYSSSSKGTGPYTYQVNFYHTAINYSSRLVSGNTFTRPGSLTGITYYVYAKDAYNCIQSDDVILFQDAPPTISAPAPICYDGTHLQ
jgi:hypothetical protein